MKFKQLLPIFLILLLSISNLVESRIRRYRRNTRRRYGKLRHSTRKIDIQFNYIRMTAGLVVGFAPLPPGKQEECTQFAKDNNIFKGLTDKLIEIWDFVTDLPGIKIVKGIFDNIGNSIKNALIPEDQKVKAKANFKEAQLTITILEGFHTTLAAVTKVVCTYSARIVGFLSPYLQGDENFIVVKPKRYRRLFISKTGRRFYMRAINRMIHSRKFKSKHLSRRGKTKGWLSDVIAKISSAYGTAVQTVTDYVTAPLTTFYNQVKDNMTQLQSGLGKFFETTFPPDVIKVLQCVAPIAFIPAAALKLLNIINALRSQNTKKIILAVVTIVVNLICNWQVFLKIIDFIKAIWNEEDLYYNTGRLVGAFARAAADIPEVA
jgi:hypothetical protein